MSESRPKKRNVEFIESYWTGGEFGSDYQWNDNHGELIRCMDCRFFAEPYSHGDQCAKIHWSRGADWYCADGERRTDE